MKILISFACCLFIFSLIGFGQSKKFPRTDKQNTIIAEVVKKLAEPIVCGSPEWAEKDFYSGTIVKRNFDKSQFKLSGFVLRDKRGRRTFINLDTDYIDGLAASASSDLSDFLLVGRPIKVWAYRCRKILYAYKISSI